jgi:hypothetical protein
VLWNVRDLWDPLLFAPPIKKPLFLSRGTHYLVAFTQSEGLADHAPSQDGAPMMPFSCPVFCKERQTLRSLWAQVVWSFSCHRTPRRMEGHGTPSPLPTLPCCVLLAKLIVL